MRINKSFGIFISSKKEGWRDRFLQIDVVIGGEEGARRRDEEEG